MFKYKDTKINVILGDITEISTDAIVNAANNTLLGGGGVDGAIHKKGGNIILAQCKKIGGCPTGESRITTAGNLKSKYVIHTVGPVYKERLIDAEFLYNSYFNSLKLALEYNLKTIAFPSISTGAYGYPLDKAIKLVFKAVMEFVNKYDEIDGLDEIVFVLHSEEDFKVYIDYIKDKLEIEKLN